MTIKEFHVGIDLGAQRLDSNIFGNIQKPEKDYYINIVIDELVRAVVNNEKNTVFSLLTYGDISEYYEAVQAHIVRKSLGIQDMVGDGYVRCQLPYNSSLGEISSGNLINGNWYQVVTAGTANLSKFGYSESPPKVDDTFKCSIADYKSPDYVTLVNGGVYKIINAGNIDFTLFGAETGEAGEIFTATNVTTVFSPSASIHLEVISEAPIWNNTVLTTLSTEDYYLYLKSDSYTEYATAITSGSLTKGYRYKVLAAGDTDLTDFGGMSINSIGSIFNCTASGTPTWSNGTTLKRVKEQPNRLLKEQDITNARTNSFGTVITSPILVIRNYGLDVYHDNKFEIEQVEVSYVRKPAKVDYTLELTCDLPESIHAKLVGLIVAYIAADIDPQTYGIKKDKAMSTEQANQQ